MIRSSCRAGNMPGLCVVPWEARQLSPGGPGARLWLCPAHPREPDGGHDDTVAEHSGELARLTRNVEKYLPQLVDLTSVSIPNRRLKILNWAIESGVRGGRFS